MLFRILVFKTLINHFYYTWIYLSDLINARIKTKSNVWKKKHHTYSHTLTVKVSAIISHKVYHLRSAHLWRTVALSFSSYWNRVHVQSCIIKKHRILSIYEFGRFVKIFCFVLTPRWKLFSITLGTRTKISEGCSLGILTRVYIFGYKKPAWSQVMMSDTVSYLRQ